ncbi:MAG TPA: MoxR family ATPase [Anaerolineae bacterium]|nr:MoxR family ATPase [Anaerolineae bacterium]
MTSYEFTGDQRYLTTPYVSNPAMREAVNMAIALGRPLLLKGEPGCGKTLLAQAVAEELGGEEGKLPFYQWNIKSTTQARDGLYRYDTIGRLRDAQLAAADLLPDEEREKLKKKFDEGEAYLQWGALGKAFRNRDRRAVVLIDEIDKADIDFPNDLLHELDRKSFTVDEANPPLPPVEAAEENKPIIFITSNDEKALPAAFLRRCLFFYIEFPSKSLLQEIVSRHAAKEQWEGMIADPLLVGAVERFWQLREGMKDKRRGQKKVSTSELLDWFRYMNRFEGEERDDIVAKLKQELLYPAALLKDVRDFYERRD